MWRRWRWWWRENNRNVAVVVVDNNNNNNNNNNINNNMFKQGDQFSYKNCYQYESRIDRFHCQATKN